MFSFEPFTLRDIGSPQVFQTGETFHGAPLIDYQHPHDLIMNLGGEYSRSLPATPRCRSRVAWCGPPPIGPPVFMHRPSAAENFAGAALAPLSRCHAHHTRRAHDWCGAIRVQLEAGAFHGREPDENRLDLDTAALDSYGCAPVVGRRPVGCADLRRRSRRRPNPTRRTIRTASPRRCRTSKAMSVTRSLDGGVGQNREVFGNLEAYLLEVTRRFAKNACPACAETVAKDILDAGFHPIGVAHTHRPSQVSALTAGYVRDVVAHVGTFGVGGDVTGISCRTISASRTDRRCRFMSSCDIAAAPARYTSTNPPARVRLRRAIRLFPSRQSIPRCISIGRLLSRASRS